MNFVKLYIGDYMRDTGTLSVAEHGAYVLMLMHAYATEKPLPTGKELHRLLRAETKADRDAIDKIVALHWYEGDGGLFNRRADIEMVKANHQREVNRTVGKLGGRPKRTETESVSESVSESLTESKPNTNPNHSQTPERASVAIATGGKPPADQPKAEDLTRAELWEAGKSLLMAQGMPKAQCGTFVGKLVKDYGESATVDAVRSAVVNRPADAASYVKATCQRLKGERKEPLTVASNAAAETAAYLAERAAQPKTKPPPEVLALVGKLRANA